MANAGIGQVEAKIRGKTYILTPTFAALMDLEMRTGLSCMRLANVVTSQNLMLHQMAAVIYAGLVGTYGDIQKVPVKLEELQEEIFKGGPNLLMKPIGDFLANCIIGTDRIEEKKTEGQVPPAETPKQ